MRATSPVQRFWAKVDKTPTCWLWQGQLTRRGYGHLSVDGVNRRVHRYAYELLVGPIPEGLTIDHLCCVKRCVNPEHLEVVTRRENIHRYIGMSETHCRRGHEYTPESTHYETYGGYERRRCRICRRENRLKREADAS